MAKKLSEKYFVLHEWAQYSAVFTIRIVSYNVGMVCSHEDTISAIADLKKGVTKVSMFGSSRNLGSFSLRYIVV